MKTIDEIIAVCPNNHKLLVGRKQMGQRIVCPECQATAWVFDQQQVVQGYRAEPSWVYTTRWLAVGVAILALFQMLPVLMQPDLVQAPVWTRLIVLGVVVQIAAAMQLAMLPDWSMVRASLFLLVGVATGYGLVLGMLLVAPKDGDLLWDLSDVRNQAPLWCVAILLLLGLLIYAVGTVAHRWHRAFSRAHGHG